MYENHNVIYSTISCKKHFFSLICFGLLWFVQGENNLVTCVRIMGDGGWDVNLNLLKICPNIVLKSCSKWLKHNFFFNLVIYPSIFQTYIVYLQGKKKSPMYAIVWLQRFIKEAIKVKHGFIMIKFPFINLSLLSSFT